MKAASQGASSTVLPGVNPVNYSNNYNGGMNDMGITSCFLTRFKAHSSEVNVHSTVNTAKIS